MRHRELSLLGASLSFPLFFTTGLSIFGGDASSQEFAFPFGFFVAVVCFFGFGLRFIASLSQAGPVLMLGGLGITTLGALVQIGVGDWSLLLIYCVPAVVGFFMAWTVNIKSDEAIHAVFIGFACAAVCAAALHLAASFVTYGFVGAFSVRGEDSIFGVFSIYQKYIYYATILAFGFFFVLIFFEGWIRWLSVLMLVSDILLIGSREAILLVLFFALASSFLEKKSLVRRVFFLVAVIATASVILFFLFIIMREHLDEFVFMAKIVSIANSEDTSSLSAGRLDTIINVTSAFDIDGLFIFFGSGFQTDIGEMGTPHNQYVEWFLRGGLVFLLFNTLFLCVAVYRHLLIGGRTHFAAGIMLLATLIISNNINTPFRVPYTSIWLWLLIGYSFRPASRLCTASSGRVRSSGMPGDWRGTSQSNTYVADALDYGYRQPQGERD